MSFLLVFFVGLNFNLIFGQFLCNNETLDLIDSSMATILNSGKYYIKYPENRQEIQPYCE
jgi:hypothetical protein